MKKRASLILSIMFLSLVVVVGFPVQANAEDENCDHYIDEYDSCVSLDDKYHLGTGVCSECGEVVTLKEKHWGVDYTKAEKLNKTYHVELYECEDCGTTYKEKEKHEWGNWKLTRKATVFKRGKKARDCEICGATQTKTTDRIKPFAKFKAKKYSLRAGKTLKLKYKIKMGRGDSVKTWKSSNKNIASVSKYGKIKAKSKGTVKITAILKSGKKATCTIKVKAKKVPKKTTQKKRLSGGTTVYWVPSGSVYHVSRYCRTLSRSRVVYSGTVQQSGKSRCCKVCG